MGQPPTDELDLEQADINGVPIDYAHDTDGMPTAIGEQTLTYRDGTALLASRTVGSVTTEYSYNEYGELDEMTTTVGGAEVLNRVFTYDSHGRIAAIDEAVNLEETVDICDYDLIGQLVGATASGARNYTNSYAYDENGNRTAVANGTDTLAAADIDHDADDRLLTYGGQSFSYSDSGHLTAKNGPGGTTQYDYGVSGELQSVSLPGGTEVTYAHDALQRRIARTVDGTTHRWVDADRLNPVAEVDEASVLPYAVGASRTSRMSANMRLWAMSRHLTLVVSFLLLCCCSDAFAQSLELPDGRVLTGPALLSALVSFQVTDGRDHVEVTRDTVRSAPEDQKGHWRREGKLTEKEWGQLLDAAAGTGLLEYDASGCTGESGGELHLRFAVGTHVNSLQLSRDCLQKDPQLSEFVSTFEALSERALSRGNQVVSTLSTEVIQRAMKVWMQQAQRECSKLLSASRSPLIVDSLLKVGEDGEVLDVVFKTALGAPLAACLRDEARKLEFRKNSGPPEGTPIEFSFPLVRQ